jgi:hypothetical protein
VAVACGPGSLDLADAAECVARLLDRARWPQRVFVGVLCCMGDGRTAAGAQWPVLQQPSVDGGRSPFLRALRAALGRGRGLLDAARASPWLEGQVRVLEQPARQARGYASAMSAVCRYLYRGERYIATVRARCRVTDAWDARAVADLRRCALRSGRPVLTQPALVSGSGGDGDGNGDGGGRISESIYSHGRAAPVFPCFAGWTERGLPALAAVPFRTVVAVRPFRCLFWSSAFSLAPAAAFHEVPWDPWYEFLPAAVCDWAMGARLWTHGWDFFSPTTGLCVEVVPAPAGTDDASCQFPASPPWTPTQMREAEDAAWQRVWCLLRVMPQDAADLGVYTLGNAPVATTDTDVDAGAGAAAGARVQAEVLPPRARACNRWHRTLAAFSLFCGVDVAARRVRPHAWVGMLPARLAARLPTTAARAAPLPGRASDGGPARASPPPFPFDPDEVKCKFGSWAQFYRTVGHRWPHAVLRHGNDEMAANRSS